MKNSILKIGGFILPAAIFWGCISEPTDDRIIEKQMAKIEMLGGTLSFSNFESYENAIQDPNEIQSFDFLSLGSLAKQSEGSQNSRILSNELVNSLEEFEGTSLLDILDEDGMMIIDEKLFFLDFLNKTVAVSTDLKLRESLKSGDFDLDKVHMFSFDDDVIGFFEAKESYDQGKHSINNDQLRVQSCPVTWGPLVPNVSTECSWDVCNWASEYVEYNYLYKAEAKNAYQSAGVYFRLKTEIKHMRKNLETTSLFGDTSADLTFNYIGYFKSKSSGSVQRNISDCMYLNNHRLDKTHYESSRGLDYFELGATFNVHLGGNHAFSGYPNSFELRKIKKS